MIKILIVDDSMTETALLKSILESEHDMQVIGYAKNGKEGVELAAQLKPDVITMDIQMPIMDGLEATQLIMSQHPIPIVVISSKANDDSMGMTFQALAAGALSVLGKPTNMTSPKFHHKCKRIVETVRSMSEIKVIKRRFYVKPHQTLTQPIIPQQKINNFEILAIGTSIGGPQALNTILSGLSKDFPIPIVIVQHMTPGFISGFTKWLAKNKALAIKIAENDELLKDGTVYLAPDRYHLEVDRVDGSLVAKLVKKPPVSGFCPSATVLLKSVAKTCGKNAIGLLLTGMGSDGAQGLLELKNFAGHTLIQDQESTVVFGMPGVAQALNAVDQIVELNKIAEYLTAITKHLKKS